MPALSGVRRKPVNVVDVTQLGLGKSARIVELQGGRQTVGKLQAMGVIVGATVVKKSASPLHGPIVLVKGSLSVAIGFGLAKKVLVEPLGL